jgi:hypothetical protein
LAIVLTGDVTSNTQVTFTLSDPPYQPPHGPYDSCWQGNPGFDPLHNPGVYDDFGWCNPNGKDNRGTGYTFRRAPGFNTPVVQAGKAVVKARLVGAEWIAAVKFRTSPFGGDNYRVTASSPLCARSIQFPLFTVWRKIRLWETTMPQPSSNPGDIPSSFAPKTDKLASARDAFLEIADGGADTGDEYWENITRGTLDWCLGGDTLPCYAHDHTDYVYPNANQAYHTIGADGVEIREEPCHYSGDAPLGTANGYHIP